MTAVESDHDGQDHADAGDREERERGFSRRQLLRAGWAVPVVLTIAPSVAFAASGVHTDSVLHDDFTPHVDETDGHYDFNLGHTDYNSHADFTGGGFHGDLPGGHGDFGGHNDMPDHTDQGFPHIDDSSHTDSG